MKLSEHIKGLFADKITLSKNIANLFFLEAKLAGLSIGPLLANIVFLVCLLSTVWLLITGLMIYSVFIIVHSLIWALMASLAFNSIVIGILIKSSLNHLHRVSFEKTRACFNKNKDD